ncbi:MAG: tRNA lysidine(34) synthetase TilS [Pseudomonadota bacterium]
MTDDAIGVLADRIVALDLAGPVGIAVSGGSDSTALLVAAGIARTDIRAATVDHGLRPDAHAEAEAVAKLCARHGWPHRVLDLSLSEGPNLQARAREARYAALADWAHGAGIGTVLLGHTADDVAETLVMRLARGAGIDGLARMAACRRSRGIDWHRPALTLTRGSLRDALRTRGVGWSDDPSNADPAFARTAARTAIDTLDLDISALAATAQALDDARESLARHALAVARAHVREDRGDLVMDGAALRIRHGTDPDPLPRILLAGLAWIGGRPYGPRRDERRHLLAAALEGRPATLAGCLLTHEGDTMRLAREVAACAPPGPTTAPWDGRWQISGPHGDGHLVAALGDDIGQTPWREAGLPRTSLLASPAVRDGARLVAAPLAGLANGWSAQTHHPFTEALIRR